VVKLVQALKKNMQAIEKITHLEGQIVFRNTVGLKLNFNAFDDLSDDPEDWKEAELAADFSNRFDCSESQYNAIDYVFDQRTWPVSRFGDGSFPIWYGSLELETSFYETAYHWQIFLKDSPGLISKKSAVMISSVRTVFSVKCQAALVDLREKIAEFPFLISPGDYQGTQSIGMKLAREGFPGLLFISARRQEGNNIAVFNKNILMTPTHFGDYIYQVDPKDLDNLIAPVDILNYGNQKYVLKI